MRVRLAAAWVLSLVTCGAAAQTLASIDGLREVGTRIKQSLDNAHAGNAPAAAELATLQARLDRVSSSADGTVAFAAKARAVTALLEQLRFEARHPRSAQIGDRHTVDVEITSATRGGSCGAALGLAESSAVDTTLRKGGEAWFILPATKSPRLRISTDSLGPDPALQVYDGCGAQAHLLASNDDNVGLDAAITIEPSRAQTHFVRVTNAGADGRIVVSSVAVSMTVSGIVHDLKTGQPIANTNVQVSPTAGGPAASAWSDQNGHYSVDVATAGDYYVYAGAQGYISQVYLNDDCPLSASGIYGCNLSQARVVTVSAQSSPANIDFSLNSGHRISGQLRGTNNVPAVGDVTLYDSAGGYIQNIGTDSVGHFTFRTLPSGTYKLEAQASGFGSQMYDHVNCDGPLQNVCDLSKAGTLTVGSQDLLDADFSLTVLASIRGTVSSASSALNASDTQFTLYDAAGNFITYGYTDYNADTYTIGALAPGNYFVVASNPAFFRQLSNGQDCASDCTNEMVTATPISLTSYGQQAEADFVLDPLPELHGYIEDAVTHTPIPNVTVILTTQPPALYFNGAASGTSDDTGNYVVRDIPGGTYYAWAVSPDHVDQIYAGITCEQTQNGSTPCDVAGATLITSAPNATIPTADFSLAPSSSISGTIRVNAGPGSDLPAITRVNIYNTSGTLTASANSDVQGRYVVNDVAPGNYTIIAAADFGGFFAQMWQNIACPFDGCIPTQGTIVSVGAAQQVAGIDFVLTQSYSVSGRVTDEDGAPIRGVAIDLFDSTDTFAGTGISDAQGYYVSLAYGQGQFYAATEAGGGYVDQVYAGIQCPQGTAYEGQCSLAGATALSISGTSTQAHIVNFVLKIGDRVFGDGFE